MKIDSLPTVIGLESHVQLSTKSKLFCACPTRGKEPNSAVCPVCLGHPGSKPVLNKTAVEMAAKVALALNCKVNPSFFFSRKTYFYPDMSKNFQITQYEIPLSENGFVELDSGKKIRIRRLHLEEDPAALIHEKGFTLVDYNRAGIPLIEIVTEPDLASAREAREFLNKLWTILGFLDVFSPGEDVLKADCNLSISGHAKVEIKNVSGFQAVERALLAEEKRQRELLSQGEEIRQQTRGFDDKSGRTVLQREKETEADYGYIFEPDLVSSTIDSKWMDAIRSTLPELPFQKARRFVREFGLSDYDAKVLCSNKKLSDLFESVSKRVSPGLGSRFLSRELLGILNFNRLEIDSVALSEKELGDLLELLESGKVSEKNAKQAAIEYVLSGVAPKVFLEKSGLLIDLGSVDTEKIVESVLLANPQAVSELKQGNQKSLNFLLGQMMRQAKGKANPRELQGFIEKKIKKK
ncbi:MAG: Asp-tRNA(Asn)/Glu-tRNA(Gln) amidotransferase subunit GatB [Candidatus Diapherotrites archaeon]|uniref:Aspartyl/glutamyl-tRNA(Asn/Gln) amidotransferase subunit B n=1 Tax=Candidatus Iainarchaeum sp. TaxID=3101447 RepID=A0A8T4L4R8_9ARCH|nr:Asp-tRNA(Asn)/Glu-tRNA(Gln) amidotransferase subunit GatB [Candidatus Diapherotrites archaeon]